MAGRPAEPVRRSDASSRRRLGRVGPVGPEIRESSSYPTEILHSLRAKFAYADSMLETSPLGDLSRRDRQRLMKFICSFAWADLQIRPEERRFVARIVTRLDLDEAERAEVEQWLKVPPSPEAVDPMQIPLSQRALFLDSVEGVIVSDGEVSVEERESFALLQDLLQTPA